ncbi:hypothetical protein ACFFIX_06790 [Metabacillus herbersteinensis]|uniref:Uncharacterized protein n=2 Tax=Metabacillus herbersteinensis TaxID=283816 RepID=A0ABV6GBV4_9BACI
MSGPGKKLGGSHEKLGADLSKLGTLAAAEHQTLNGFLSTCPQQ